MKIYPQTLPAVILICLTFHASKANTLHTNFSDPNLATGIYANGESLGTGTISNLTSQTATGYTVQIATSAYSSAKVIQFIDNISSTTGAYGVSANISTLYSTGSGYLSGSYTFTPLSVTSGTRSTFVFSISSGSYVGSTASAVQLTLNSNYSFNYFNGTSTLTAKDGSNNNITLTAGESYTVQWWTDLTSTTQDTYGFSLYDSTNTLIFNSGTQNTRAANISTTSVYMVLVGGTDSSPNYSSTDPFVEISSITVANVIPEVKTNALLIFGSVLALIILKRKRKILPLVKI